MSIHDCINIAAQHYGFPTRLIAAPRQDKKLVLARHVAAWLAYQGYGETLAQIGRQIGKRDPKTISTAVRRIEEQRALDPAFKAETDELLARIFLVVGEVECARSDS